MMWCNHCNQAVTPDFKLVKDELGYVFNISVCSECEKEVYTAPDKCAMCGEYVEPGKGLCDPCADDISAAVDVLATCGGRTREAVKDGMAEWLNL